MSDSRSGSSPTPTTANEDKSNTPSPEKEKIPRTVSFYKPSKVKRDSAPDFLSLAGNSSITRRDSRLALLDEDEHNSSEGTPLTSNDNTPARAYTRLQSPRGAESPTTTGETSGHDSVFSTFAPLVNLPNLPPIMTNAPVQIFGGNVTVIITPPKSESAGERKQTFANLSAPAVDFLTTATPSHPASNESSSTEEKKLTFADPLIDVDFNKTTLPDTSHLQQIQRNNEDKHEQKRTCKSIFKAIFTHPLFVPLSLGVTSAIPTALYALMGPSHKQPNDIGTAWWDNMDDLIRAISVACCISSLAINSLMNETALAGVSARFKKIKDHPGKASISLLLASAATVASCKIAWDGSPAWAGIPGASFNMLANGITTLATRSVTGAFIATEKLEGLFRSTLCKTDTIRKAQMDLIDSLKDFDPTFKRTIENFIQEKKFSLNEDAAIKVLRQIRETMKEEHANERSCSTSLEIWGSRLFASLMAAIVFPTFTEKGSSGLGIGIGLIPGLASSIFYYISCRDTIPTYKNAFKYLKRYPREIPEFLFWLVANVAASMSMFNVAQGVQDKPNGIFPFLKELPPLLFPLLNAIAGGFVNSTFTMRRQFSYTGKNFKFDDFIRYCEQNVILDSSKLKRVDSAQLQVSVDEANTAIQSAIASRNKSKSLKTSKSLFSFWKEDSTKTPLLGNQHSSDSPIAGGNDIKDHHVQLQAPPTENYEVPSVRSLS